ncbi:MAG TPA: sporulation protein [Pseudonocardiaceae bacterium]|nr:sporulation protein [Pseudonocardiaceae bacterium]
MAGGVLDMVRKVVSANQVFAEPVERDGTTVIGVARVAGGGGGDQFANGSNDGGVGLYASPVGAYVIKDGKVRWMPAVDVNALIVILTVILVAILVRRARRRRRKAAAQGR